MRRQTLRTSLTVAALLATAAAAWAQGAVDLRINLSTQPVYSSHDRRPIHMDYVRASSLLATGNVRGGKALMINRSFIEDRYFSGSLTRFYRDTVSVQDVLGGITHGGLQPYFRPGSLTTSSSSLAGARIRSADPFGAVTQPFGGASSPFQITYSAPVTAQPVWYRAQFPAQYDFGTLGSEISSEAMNYSIASFLARHQTQPSDLSRLEGYYSTPWARLPATSDWIDSLTSPPQPLSLTETQSREDPMLSLRPPVPQDQPPLPYGQKPTAPPTPTTGLPTEILPNQDDSLWANDLSFQAKGNTAAGAFEESLTTGYLFPQQAAEVLLAPRQARTLDEQYYQLGLLDLEAGAYAQAGEAFRQVGSLNAQRSREAAWYEGISWLLAGQYFRAAYLLQRSVTEAPDRIDPTLRLTSVVNRPDDWAAAEAALETVLAERPQSPVHSFVLAYLRIFQGRPETACDLLAAAEKHPDYAAAARLLREKVLK
jgi:hypothetical protein